MPRRWVAVFDLDGTLTWRDTLMQFLMSFLRRHPVALARAVAPALRLLQLPGAKSRSRPAEIAGHPHGHGRRHPRRHRALAPTRSSDALEPLAIASGRPLSPCSKRIARPAITWYCCRRVRIYTCRASAGRWGSNALCAPRSNGRGTGSMGTLKTANRRGAEKLRCLTWLRDAIPRPAHRRLRQQLPPTWIICVTPIAPCWSTAMPPPAPWPRNGGYPPRIGLRATAAETNTGFGRSIQYTHRVREKSMRKTARNSAKIVPSDITPYERYLSRRALLAGGLGLAATQGIGGCSRRAFGQSAADLTYVRNAALSVTEPPNSVQGHHHLQQLLRIRHR